MAPTIDWSQAPDYATHYDELAEVFCNKRGYWCADCYWRADPGQEDWGTSRYIPRPTSTWNGEGLPPVGTHCAHQGTAHNLDWQEVVVLAHTEVCGRQVAVFQYANIVSYSSAQYFRPIRTPEQIAADERLHNVRNACSAIAETLDDLRGKTMVERAALAVVEAMIDAGYRKVTEA